MSVRLGPRAALGALWVALLLATGAFASDPWRVEALYVEGVGPVIAGALVAATRPFPSSVAEWVEAGAIAVALAWCLAAIARAWKRPGADTFGRLLGEAWAGVGFALLAFYLSWGLAYSRPRLEARFGWDEPFAVEADELESLAAALVDRVNLAYYDLHHLPDIGVMTGSTDDLSGIDPALDVGWERVVARYQLHPSVGVSRGPTKPLISSGLFTWLGIGGFYFPYTGEANINAWAPAWQRPHTHAHEMAHQRFVASENEANFMGFLACIHSDDPLVSYSGWLHAQRQVLRQLLKVDPWAGHGQIVRRLPGVQRDVDGSHAFWSQYDGTLSEVGWAVNDAYLKANQVEGGASSYARAVRLLVRWARTCGALPPVDEPLPFGLGQCDPLGR